IKQQLKPNPLRQWRTSRFDSSPELAFSIPQYTYNSCAIFVAIWLVFEFGADRRRDCYYSICAEFWIEGSLTSNQWKFFFPKVKQP
ncbi:hypothetical protein PIB30_087784, partial [Stylosanthes scabra]|nr:hypothetical protein [Stylosanthes scabra]